MAARARANDRSGRRGSGDAHVAEGLPAAHAALLALQRSAGNTAVAEALAVQRDACFIPKSKKAPYAHLQTAGAVGPGEYFDASQRSLILKENSDEALADLKRKAAKPGLKDLLPLYYSNQSDKPLYSQAALNPSIAEVDHIVPQEKGGGNTELNAQVLSAEENNAKGSDYPWGGYKGMRVFDPALGAVFNTVEEADQRGADLTGLEDRGWIPPRQKKRKRQKT